MPLTSSRLERPEQLAGPRRRSSSPHLRHQVFRAVALAALLAASAAPAQGQCTFNALTTGTAQTAAGPAQAYTFNQTHQFWTGVAVRSAAGSNWDLEVYQDEAASPGCVTTLLGSSTRASGVDFVVGDFNTGHDPLGIYHPKATQVGGSGAGTVEWDDQNSSIFVNGTRLVRSTGATDVIEVWDVFLNAGHTYEFFFSRTGADAKMLLFKSGAGPYWAGRAAALFEATASRSFTPSASGFYGLVVINDNGVTGSYTVGVGECQAPQELTSGIAVSTSGFAEKHFLLDQNHVFWMAFGARGASNWNVETYLTEGGSSYPACLSDQLGASSLAAPSVDFVVGNFNNQLTSNIYGRAHYDQDIGTGSAMVEWDSGADFIPVDGGTSVNRTTGATDVLEAWDVFLTSGQTYQVLFNTSGADLKMLLFAPGLAWADRADRMIERAGNPAYVPYVATQTGWHGLVVVNDNGADGTYEIQINQGVVGVGDDVAPATALDGMRPNPTRGSAHIQFALHDRSPVSFEVLDVAGRVVSSAPEREWGPGRWTVGWDGRRMDGGRLAPGVYFLRMKVAGKPIGLRKFALLD